MLAAARRRGGSLAGLLHETLRSTAVLDDGLSGLLLGSAQLQNDCLPRILQPLLSLRHFASEPLADKTEPKSLNKSRRKRAASPRKAHPARERAAPSSSDFYSRKWGKRPQPKVPPVAKAVPAQAEPVSGPAASREPPQPQPQPPPVSPPPPQQQQESQQQEQRLQPPAEAPKLTWRGLKEEAAQLEKNGSPLGALSEHDQQLLASALQRFAESSAMQDKALALYVSATAFPRLAGLFRDAVLGCATPRLLAALRHLGRQQRTDALFGLFAEWAVQTHSRELQAYREAVRSMDLRRPHLWYPVARALKRRFIYHAGPTNSGKTFTALEALRAAPSGVYCGPLRLLAMEVYDTLNVGGTRCNLITGQERKLVPGAEHTSCTIEAISTSKRTDVAVIDEIQLLGDDQRGWAWTRALQGLPANEIHVCGDASAIRLVSALAKAMGEDLEVRTYRRFTPVQVEPEGLPGGWRDVQPGDCVVAFSRKAIYEIKSRIEKATGMRTCVVYGALPPETRRQQARLFNEPGNDFSVLVASDAVGMGLNLNIRRIVFATLRKWDGGAPKQISVSEMKQIAGRAGRRNSEWPVGYATCFDPEDVPTLRAAVRVPQARLATTAAGLFPEFEHLEAYAGQSLNADFQAVLARFAAEARLDGTYFFCRQDGMELAAKLLARLDGLSLQEKYWFCMAPVNLREPRQASALLHFASRYAARQPVALELRPPPGLPRTPDELGRLEQLHQVVTLWLWLSNRFGSALFPGREGVQALSERLTDQMHAALQEMYQEGAAPPRFTRRSVRKIAEEMQMSYVQNLSREAQEHLREASAVTVRAFLQRYASGKRKQRTLLLDRPPDGMQRATA